jgi:hypothetical protein
MALLLHRRDLEKIEAAQMNQSFLRCVLRALLHPDRRSADNDFLSFNE